jgi:polar amino acid transport system substrate-binding protein
MTGFARRDLLKAAIGGALVLGAEGSLVTARAQSETTWQRVLRTKRVQIGSSNSEPYSYLDGSGKIIGQGVDVLRAALSEHGTFEIVGSVGAFASLIPGLLANRFDVVNSGVNIRPARCEQVLFGNPDSLGHDAFAVKRGNPLNIHSYEDVAKNPKARISFIRGSIEEGYAKRASIPESQWLVLTTDQEILAAVQSGRADIAASAAIVLIMLLKKMNDSSIEMATPFQVPAGPDGKPEIDYSAMCFRKQDADFKKAYDAGLAKLVASGELQRINAKWGLLPDMTPNARTSTAEEVCKG